MSRQVHPRRFLHTPAQVVTRLRRNGGAAPLMRVHELLQPDLAAAVEAAGGILLMTDAQRLITWCNPAFTKLTGYTLDEVRGRSPGQVLQFEGSDPGAIAAMRSALQAGQGYRGRISNRSKAGRVYWLDIDIRPMHDGAGRVSGYVSTQSDVTEQVLAHEYLRSVVKSAVSGILVQELDGIIVGCNPETERLFELEEKDILGRNALDPGWRLLDEDGQLLRREDYPSEEALRSGEPVRGRVVGLTLSGGRRRWLEVSCQRIDGRAEGSCAVVSSFNDITAQRSAMAELAAERLRLRATLDGTQAGVWEWNLQTGEARINERWADIGGWTLAELGPVTIQTWLDRVHPDDLPQLDSLLRAHAAGQMPFFAVDCRMRHREGHWIWVAVRGRIDSFSADGKPWRMYGTHLDITAAKEAERALHRANLQLQALFELSPVGMALSDPNEGRFVEFNDAMADMLGHSREHLGKLYHRDLIPRDDRVRANELIQSLMQRGRFGPDDVEVLHRNGQRVPVSLSAMRVSLPDGSERIWTIMQDMTPRLRLETRLRAEARTDRLTGLPNRASLMEQLEHCVLQCEADPALRFALLFLDFDRFKRINDTLGHEAGDQLLQHIADRLRRFLRAIEVPDAGTDGLPFGNAVARFGGDEFVLMLTQVHSSEAVAQIAARLLEVLSVPYMVERQEIHSSVSIGIAMSGVADGSAASLLRNADLAMYEAKRAGRATYAFFDQSMLARISRAVRIEEALRHAVALNQLSLVYQPIVNLETGAMTSVEALVRWQHPELGSVSPAEFIPIAEESGLIVPVGEWVLWEACRQWRRWQDESPAAAPAMMSVNLSRVQMALGERLCALVSRVLQSVRMPSACLQLEVTEREVMRDPAAVRSLMNGLRTLGVKLAMDDFGTGVSSLGCLRDYPFDVIKIDKSFVDDLSGSSAMLAVIHATVSVIENLGMTSVAEGIEDEMQVGVLQSLGCRFGQGYHFSRPVAADRLLQVPTALRRARG